jgi:hypothetical protein
MWNQILPSEFKKVSDKHSHKKHPLSIPGSYFYFVTLCLQAAVEFLQLSGFVYVWKLTFIYFAILAEAVGCKCSVCSVISVFHF